jgi:hypothetical protein
MTIEGFFSDKIIENDLMKYNTCLRIGLAYVSADNFVLGNGDVYLYLKKLPSFDEVYNYFMSCKVFALKLNKQQDMCLSLLYNPYFEEFYNKLIIDIEELPNNRLKFLKKYLLTDLADSIQNKIIMDYNMSAKEYYIKHDIFNKSNELLKLISK